jgi:hypothetical protein
VDAATSRRCAIVCVQIVDNRFQQQKQQFPRKNMFSSRSQRLHVLCILLRRITLWATSSGRVHVSVKRRTIGRRVSVTLTIRRTHRKNQENRKWTFTALFRLRGSMGKNVTVRSFSPRRYLRVPVRCRLRRFGMTFCTDTCKNEICSIQHCIRTRTTTIVQYKRIIPTPWKL